MIDPTIRRYDDYLSQVAPHVQTFFQPLFEKTPLDFIDYAHYHDNGHWLILMNNADLFRTIIDEKMNSCFHEVQAFHLSGNQRTFMSEAMAYPKAARELNPKKWEKNILIRKQFNRHHQLYFVTRRNGYFQVVSFASLSESRSIFDFYLNAAPMLEQYIKRFEAEIPTLTKDKPAQGVFLPNYRDQSLKIPKSYDLSTPCIFNIKQFYLYVGKKMVVLSKRQVLCMLKRLEHYPIALIAKTLGIKPRTVHTHIQQTKQKLGIKPMYLIRKIFEDNGLISTSSLNFCNDSPH